MLRHRGFGQFVAGVAGPTGFDGPEVGLNADKRCGPATVLMDWTTFIDSVSTTETVPATELGMKASLPPFAITMSLA